MCMCVFSDFPSCCLLNLYFGSIMVCTCITDLETAVYVLFCFLL